MTTKSYDRSAILRDAWNHARWAAAALAQPVRAFISAAMRTAWALAKGIAAPAHIELVAQPIQQQQANASAPVSPDEIKGLIRAAATAGDRVGMAALFAQLPGVERCEPEGLGRYDNRLIIKATGTRCGTLDKAYGVPFLFDAFGIPALPKDDEALDRAIAEVRQRKVAYVERIERDGFQRGVDRTIVWGPFTGQVEALDDGRVAVTVYAALRRGSSRDLGRAVIEPRMFRQEVVEAALAALGYGNLGLDMDADDGSLLWTRARHALNADLDAPAGSIHRRG